MTGGSEAAAAMFTLFYIIPPKSTAALSELFRDAAYARRFSKTVPSYFEHSLTIFYLFCVRPAAIKSGSTAETNSTQDFKRSY